MVQQLIGLAQDTAQNKTQIQELQEEMDKLADKLQWVIFELQRLAEREASEREKLELRLENALLRFERRLPPARGK
jgi:ElaB/YqjD/DUF883 family membrane-anchored ribosome-binding protein